MISPRYEKIYSEDLIHTQGLVPNYHLTADLTPKQIRFLIKSIINLAETVPDWLPMEIRQGLGLLDLSQALRQIHFPKNRAEIAAASRRLGFAELFLRQLKAQKIKHELKSRQAPPIKFQEPKTRAFVSNLPFKLTDSQKRAAWEILKDLGQDAPMSRLLQGDVGSGKTIVAALAFLNIILNKQQAVLMAPTEILARQHFKTFSELFAASGFKIALMLGGGKNKKNPNPKKTADVEIASDPPNSADLIIGTHALIQSDVNFPHLALAVVDEQHRFGVVQRQKILDFNSRPERTPHFLSLTATPIPRSLALAIYGDLDLSVIKEMPRGRQPIITKIVSEEQRPAAYDFIRTQIRAGRQAFVICPLIDESDKLGVKSVKKEHEKLDQEIFPELKVGLLHGKLKPAEKEKIMAEFAAGEIQVLVATTVVEVGINVPNAAIMIIEGAERFGLAQLHQARGRVGRDKHQSYCFLFISQEANTSTKTRERLNALTKYQDGPTLARIDLKLRGAGELYGEIQSGFPELQIASLFDYELIKKARDEAAQLTENDPELKKYPRLREKLGEWENQAHLE
jgi:ATP-dependent DNA helicase RecG